MAALDRAFAGALIAASFVLAGGHPVAARGADGSSFGDLDGDSVEEFALSYALADASGIESFWTVDQAVLEPWWLAQPGSGLAWSDRAVTADVDGDGTAEVVGVDPGVRRFVVLDGAGGVVQVSGGADVGGTDLRVLSGDFDGDAVDDVVALWSPSPGRTRVVWARGSSSGLQPASVAWESQPGAWDLSATIVAAGDVEGDDDDEVVLLYEYRDVDVVALWAMPGTTSGPVAPLFRWNSCQRCWDLDRTSLAVGDIDGDAVDDVTMFYDYGGATSAWWTFFGWDLRDGGFPAPFRLWLSAPGGFDAGRFRVGAGDVDGDGRDEAVGLYDHGSARTRGWSFELNGDQVHAAPVFPPLNGPWDTSWAAGELLTAFDWVRTSPI